MHEEATARPWRDLADHHRSEAEYLRRRLARSFGIADDTRRDIARLAALLDDIAALGYRLDATAPAFTRRTSSGWLIALGRAALLSERSGSASG